MMREKFIKDLELLSEIKKKSYKDQAIWFLNSYDEDLSESKTCELVWKMHKKCAEIDELKEEGSCLNNEVAAHRVLECSGAPATDFDLRKFLAEINPDYSMISLVELLLFHFNVSWRHIVNVPPWYDGKSVVNSQNALIKAKEWLESAVNAEKKSRDDAETAKNAEEIAAYEKEKASKAAELFRREEPYLSLAKEKAEAALLHVKHQEEEARIKVKNLESIALDDTKGIVKKNRAKAELAMMQNEDPLPLQTAKIQNEASIRKLQKASVYCRKVAVAAEAARPKADKAEISAKKAKQKALDAAKEAKAAIPHAKAAFERLKTLVDEMMELKKLPLGTIFYIDREVKETEKFLPVEKFKEAKKAAECAKKVATAIHR